MNDSLARAPYAPVWSAGALAARPAETPVAPEAPRRHIEIAPSREQKRARPRVVYAIAAVSAIVVVVAAKLLLSGITAEGAYVVDRLSVENKQLQRTVQTAKEGLEAVSSPQYLAANAEALGMVANVNPVYLRLSDGAVLGSPVPAGADAGGLGGARTLVPNALLTGVPLVTDPVAAEPGAPGTATAPPAADAATDPTLAAPPAATPVEPTSIPTPVTH